MDKPTLDQFLKYYKVQMGGRYNMITEADSAAIAAGLDIKTYFAIINNYTELRKEAEKKGLI